MAPLLSVEDVSVVRDGVTILDGISFRLTPGQHTAILGPNGCGKSTLLRLLAREIHPFAGQGVVKWFGRSDWTQTELRQRIGFVQPVPHQSLLRDFTAEEMIVSGQFGTVGVTEYSDVDAKARQRCVGLAESLEISPLLGRSFSTLSAGETQRVLIARALMPQPRVLILDEPTNGLDFVKKSGFRQLLSALPGHVETILLVTHHFDELDPTFQRILLMKSGRIVHETHRSELASAAVSAVFGCGDSLARLAITLLPK